MDKTSVFGLDPDQLDELLSLGSNIVDGSGSDGKDSESGLSEMLVEQPGSWIGRYQLLRVLGEGGMGIVYLAEQAEPIRRQVALKVIKPGMDSRRVIARFEAERQALALLDHPNIAHVHDAGTTESGRPYFVMEYVEGLSITEHCDCHKLVIEDRLNLFRQVCLAVQHAHQKGIIHRDIKPSNILVSTEDDKSIPKIIDFGVAKAITHPLTDRTLITEQGQLFGTPEYMSPEQADMARKDIDTRSDIYSLGVLLYVLLTGVLPFDSTTFREGGVENIRKTIRETDPRTPSTRLNKLGEEAKKVAENRRIEIGTLAKYLRRELEWIPLKAMRKERSERYRSASELADDVENYLRGAPLIAGPLSTIYRLKKFVRRNQALAIGIAAVLAILIAGVVVSTLFAVTAKMALNREARARAEAQAIADFLTQDVLASVNEIKGREATVADILDIASESLGSRFKDQPLVEAEINWTLGRTYGRLGDSREAMPYLARAYQIRREQLGERATLTRLSKNFLAFAYVGDGEYRKAEQLFSQLVEQGPGLEEPDMFPCFRANLACGVYLEQGRYKEAEQLLIDTWEMGTAWWEKFGHERKPWQPELAEIYLFQGRYEDAEQLFTQILKEQGDVVLKESSMSGLGHIYMAQGRYSQAEDLFIKGIEIGRLEHPGENHPHTLKYMNELAVLRTKQKQYNEAERLFHEALETRKLKLGPDHPHTLESKNDLAVLYKEKGDHEKAEPLLLDAIEGRRRKLGDTHPHTLESMNNLITLYEVWNKPEKANQWRAKLPKEH